MNKFKFARLCDATNKGMNEGYVVGDGELYFSEEKYLVEWLRSRGGMEGLTDEYILDEAYGLEEYYYTEWEELDDDEWYESEHEDGSDAVLVSADDFLKIRFESYTDEELQTFNGDNEETLKNWNRKDAIEEAIRSYIEEQNN